MRGIHVALCGSGHGGRRGRDRAVAETLSPRGGPKTPHKKREGRSAA
jgi:hypothetical protein